LEAVLTAGAMMCGAVSTLSGETAVERRSACIVYVNLVEGALSSVAHFRVRTRS
jgi:hypothetical protein